MADWEKVIKGIECLSSEVVCHGSDCPYYDFDCTQKITQDVLELLKEQEPLLVRDINLIFIGRSGNCPSCGRKLDSTINTHYCGECGQAVKWDE